MFAALCSDVLYVLFHFVVTGSFFLFFFHFQCTALGSLCRNLEIAVRGPDGSNLLGKSMEEMQVDGLLSAFEGAVPGAWWGHLCVPPLLWVHGQPGGCSQQRHFGSSEEKPSYRCLGHQQSPIPCLMPHFGLLFLLAVVEAGHPALEFIFVLFLLSLL